ncbi:hypothetical protein KEM52_006387 [Ascosphaera acerosa]|nr:hypothetical protein KEM52_006387 [Ascosphaera acerosa]
MASATDSSILILDGGLGTTLEDEHGLKFESAKTPLWSSHLLLSSDGLDVLRDCQRSFRDAGADILATGTYQVSEEGFARTPLPPTLRGTAPAADRSNFGLTREEIVSALGSGIAATLQVDAEKGSQDERRGGVALSLGPYGACMVPGQEYSGNYDEEHRSEQSLCDWHLRRLALIKEGLQKQGIELSRLRYIAFETVPRIEEIRAIRRAVQDGGLSSTPFWISCVYPNDDSKLPDGSTIRQVVSAMLTGDRPRPFGVGINCTKLHKLPGLIALLEASVRDLLESKAIEAAPTLLLYPDGTNGEVYDTVTQSWVKLSDWESKGSWEEQLATTVSEARDRGIFTHLIVGGCCKARPIDIQRLRAKLLG